jgi:hypothetical protein
VEAAAARDAAETQQEAAAHDEAALAAGAYPRSLFSST